MKKGNLTFCRGAVFALFLVMVFTAVQANAAIVSYATRAAFDLAFPTAAVETWDAIPANTLIADGATLNGITYNTSAGAGGALVTDFYIGTTDFNTLGGANLTYFDTPDSITFAFATPLTAFGIDITSGSPFDGAYQATTNLNDVALSVYDPFPGFDIGQFLGFSSTAAFNALTIALGPNGDVNLDSYTLDTMRTVQQSPVPLPPSLLLFGSGLVGLGFLRRKVMKI